MSTNHKIKKWTPEWVKQVRNITQIKENDVHDKILAQITTANTEIEKKEAQIKDLEKDKASVSTLYLALERLKEQKEQLKKNPGGLTTYKSAWADFIGTGSNKYRTEGWIKLVKDYPTCQRILLYTKLDFNFPQARQDWRQKLTNHA